MVLQFAGSMALSNLYAEFLGNAIVGNAAGVSSFYAPRRVPYGAGGNSTPYVTFARGGTVATSPYLDLGPRTANCATNGGLTFAMLFRFAGGAASSPGNSEPIFVMRPVAFDGNASPNHTNEIYVTRQATTSAIQFFGLNGNVFSSSFYTGSTGGSVAQGEWAVIAGRHVVANSTSQLFKNDVLAVANTNPTSLTDRSFGSVLIGRGSFGDPGFNGDLATLLVWDRALSSAELTQAYQFCAGYSGAAPPVGAIVDFRAGANVAPPGISMSQLYSSGAVVTADVPGVARAGNAIAVSGFYGVGAPQAFPPTSGVPATWANVTPGASLQQIANVTTQAYGNGTYVVLAKDSYGNLNLAQHSPQGAVNNQLGGQWLSNYMGPGGGNVPTWIQLQLPAAFPAYSYRIMSRWDSPVNQPYAITLAGSTDGNAWTTLDTRTGLTWAGALSEVKTFVLSNVPGAGYQYYRLTCSNAQAGNWGLRNWRLYGPDPGGVLRGLSPAGRANLVAVYALRLAVPTWTGPAVTVRHGGNNANMAFYANEVGALGTGYLARGTSLAAFLAGNTGYVTTWHDQTGRGKNMVQPLLGAQPLVALNDGYGNAAVYAQGARFMNGPCVFDANSVADLHWFVAAREAGPRINNVLFALGGNVLTANVLEYRGPRGIFPYTDGAVYFDCVDDTLTNYRVNTPTNTVVLNSRIVVSMYKSSSEQRTALRVNQGTRYYSGNNSQPAVVGNGIALNAAFGANNYVYGCAVFSSVLGATDESTVEVTL